MKKFLIEVILDFAIGDFTIFDAFISIFEIVEYMKSREGSTPTIWELIKRKKED